jgi:hypothetical protein
MVHPDRVELSFVPYQRTALTVVLQVVNGLSRHRIRRTYSPGAFTEVPRYVLPYVPPRRVELLHHKILRPKRSASTIPPEGHMNRVYIV